MAGQLVGLQVCCDKREAEKRENSKKEKEKKLEKYVYAKNKNNRIKKKPRGMCKHDEEDFEPIKVTKSKSASFRDKGSVIALNWPSTAVCM